MPSVYLTSDFITIFLTVLKRCTIRFDSEGDGPVCFAKVFADNRGERLHATATDLWHAACSGALAVAVPRSLRWDSKTRTLWQAAVAGRPVDKRLFGANGPQLAQKMGQALASIATSELTPPSSFSREDQWQEARKQGDELCRRVPWLRGAVDRLMDEVAKLNAAAPKRPLRPIHGAPHAHHWLHDGEKLGLVDFDGFTFGEAELDLATFISEMDFEKRSAIDTVALNLAFLTGYAGVAGEVDPRLLQAYCAQKRLSKALKLAYAIHPEGDMRAEQAVGRALVCALGNLDEMAEANTPLQGVVAP